MLKYKYLFFMMLYFQSSIVSISNKAHKIKKNKLTIKVPNQQLQLINLFSSIKTALFTI